MSFSLLLQRCISFNRAVADRLAPRLARTSLTPNQITFLAMASGVLAGACFAGGTRGHLVAGAALLQASFILDNCDGAVARLKSMQSRFGMWFDYAADVIVEWAMWAGLALAAVRQGHDAALVTAAASAAAAGSVINWVRVVRQRRRRGHPLGMQGSGSMRAVADLLSDDGDPSAAVWIFAWIGYPGILLAAGALYIHALWLFAAFGPGRCSGPKSDTI